MCSFLLGPTSAALLLIDIQKAFEREYWSYWAGAEGRRNNTGAEALAGELLAFWREHRRPVFHIRHDSILPDSPLLVP
jgi:nicotinamidase-related amidase